jgi:Protein of unknown function (DUF3748)/WD40-like Beta Propeller Repeat
LNNELTITIALLATALFMDSEGTSAQPEARPRPPLPMTPDTQRQITDSRTGHILTNIGVWSPDSLWIVYDIRSDPAGDAFDGRRIEMVNVVSGTVKILYEAMPGACCGVATFHPSRDEVVFILGPEHPTKDWQYCAWHRQGVIVQTSRPGEIMNLDARNLTPPFTPGALRGGSHLHVWDAAGQWVSYTYEDHVLAVFNDEAVEHESNLRNVGVSIPGRPVKVAKTHPRNRDGKYFSVLVTRTKAKPESGSDEIRRACEEAWVGTNGYIRSTGFRQKRALAFQGQVRTVRGEDISEVFIVDLPDDLTAAGDGPLAGTETRAPCPPRGTRQRRLTFTAERKYAGLQGPRHWLRSSPAGDQIAFLMKDDDGVVQLWTVSPNGGPIAQVTRNPWPIASAFSWSPDGSRIAHVMDGSVCVTEPKSGTTTRLTDRTDPGSSPRPEACVFSPDGKRIAFVRSMPAGKARFNQLWVVETETEQTHARRESLRK